jgi:hypothetical protein
LFLFGGGAWLLLARLQLFLGVRAQGEVVGYVRRMRSRAGSRIMFMPLVRYGSLHHGEREFQSRMSAYPERWPVGTELPVAYSETDPAAPEIATPVRLWLAPIALWLFGIGMIAAALKA